MTVKKIPYGKTISYKEVAKRSGRPKAVRVPSLESNLLKFAQKREIKIDSLETMDEIISSLDELDINDSLKKSLKLETPHTYIGPLDYLLGRKN